MPDLGFENYFENIYIRQKCGITNKAAGILYGQWSTSCLHFQPSSTIMCLDKKQSAPAPRGDPKEVAGS